MTWCGGGALQRNMILLELVFSRALDDSNGYPLAIETASHLTCGTKDEMEKAKVFSYWSQETAQVYGRGWFQCRWSVEVNASER